MENNRLTEAQSLELITSAIRDSRSRLARNTGVPFLIWGYVIATVAIIEAVAKGLQLEGSGWPACWIAVPVFGLLGMMIFRRKTAGAKERTRNILTPTWIILGTTAFIINTILWGNTPVALLLLSVGSVITGIITAEKSLTVCGVVGIMASAITPIHKFFYLVAVSAGRTETEWTSVLAVYYLIYATIIAIIMIVPGHIIRYKYCKRK